MAKNTAKNKQVIEEVLPEDQPTGAVLEETETPAEVEQPIEEEPQAESMEAVQAPIAEVSVSSSSMVISSGDVRVISSSLEERVDTSLVNVKINYPEGYTHKKYLKEGHVYPVSKETADEFVDRGIATIV